MNWDTDAVSLTLQSRDYKDPQCVVIQTEPIVLESNQNHATVTDSGICPTLSASMGLGGGYVPMITELVKQSDDPVIALQGSMIGREDKNGPQGSGVSEDVSFTLTSADRHAVCYGISAYESNAMKSDNPHSGVYEADTSRTLDTSGGNPACNQGGIVVVEPKAVDLYGGTITDDTACTLTENTGVSAAHIGPSVMCAAGFIPGNGAKAEGIGYEEEVSPTLRSCGEAGCVYPDVARTLTSRQDGSPCVDRGPDVVVFESHDQDARYRDLGEVSETVSAKYGTGGGNQPIVVSIGNDSPDVTPCAQSDFTTSDVVGALCARDYKDVGNQYVDEGKCVVHAVGIDGYNATETDDVSATLGVNCGMSTGRNGVMISSEDDEVYGLDRAAYNQGKNALFDFSIESEKIGCQTTKGPGAVCSHYIVRRLTPLEAERLQGLPDRWTDIGDWVDDKGKKHKCSDAARYKAIGNGIAVPPWLWVLSRLNQFCEDKTMASLFDGVGTFPMIWSFLNGKENCVWSSEIEPFPIAVSKYHFPDEDDSEQE